MSRTYTEEENEIIIEAPVDVATVAKLQAFMSGESGPYRLNFVSLDTANGFAPYELVRVGLILEDGESQ